MNRSDDRPGRPRTSAAADYEDFFAEAEPRLYRALVAAYGIADGREATVDALSWGWQNWDRVRRLSNPIGYLYRVGQTSARAIRRRRADTFDPSGRDIATDERPFLSDIWPIVAGLPEQQRAVVVLVHGYGWSQQDAATTMGVRPSTVHRHLRRAERRLRTDLDGFRD